MEYAVDLLRAAAVVLMDAVLVLEDAVSQADAVNVADRECPHRHRMECILVLMGTNDKGEKWRKIKDKE